MKQLIKYISGKTAQPLIAKYLAKTRTYHYKNIHLIIPPEVFHPGFFFSTKLLLQQVDKFDLDGKTFLELGAGSGLISFFAAKKGAHVTATDINTIAIEYLHKNAASNNVQLQIICSDIFQQIPAKEFDYIIINPPYYKKNPTTLKEYAWFCGENGEYFEKLFASLGNYMSNMSCVYMILCDGCDIEMVQAYAAKNKFQMICIFQKNNLVEKNFIFKIDLL